MYHWVEPFRHSVSGGYSFQRAAPTAAPTEYGILLVHVTTCSRITSSAGHQRHPRGGAENSARRAPPLEHPAPPPPPPPPPSVSAPTRRGPRGNQRLLGVCRHRRPVSLATDRRVDVDDERELTVPRAPPFAAVRRAVTALSLSLSLFLSRLRYRKFVISFDDLYSPR